MGGFLRLGIYIVNPSLWVDEANTAYKLQVIPLWKMAVPQGSNYCMMHAYPVGFLWLSKIFIRLWGSSEYVLRFFPFLSSVISLFLFAYLSERWLQATFRLLSVFLFAIAPSLLAYGAMLKPFSSDILFGLITLWLFIHLHEKERISLKDILIFGVLGALLHYFSFPATFMLFSLWLGFIVFFSITKQGKKQRALGLLGIIWFSGFAFYYFFSLRYFFQDTMLQASHHQYFWPLDQGWAALIRWPLIKLNEFFVEVLFWPRGIFLIFLLGIVSISMQKQLRPFLIINLAPLCIALALAFAQKYPFGNRTCLYMVPLFIWGTSAGLCAMPVSLIKRGRVFLMTLLSIFLVVYSSVQTRKFCQRFHDGEQARAAILYLKNLMRPTDHLVINNHAQYGYVYYAGLWGLTFETQCLWRVTDSVYEDEEGYFIYIQDVCYGFDQNGFFTSVNKMGDLRAFPPESPADFPPAGRTWYVLIHCNDDLKLFLQDLVKKKGGRILNHFQREGVFLFLVDDVMK